MSIEKLFKYFRNTVDYKNQLEIQTKKSFYQIICNEYSFYVLVTC